jgi:ABC-type lipoprotein release transport system permease subunit
VNDSLGRAAVRIAFRYLRRRYRREIRIGIGLAAVAVGVGVALASRNVREG